MRQRKFNVGDAVAIKSKSGWYSVRQGDTGVVHSTEFGYTYVLLDKETGRYRPPRYFASSMLEHFILDVPLLGDDDEDCI